MMKKNILLVDDDEDIIEFLKYNLEKEGFNVITANNGSEALSKLSNQIDLILLDIMMPKMDGFEVIKEIRQNDFYKELPVIFLTAKSAEADEIKGLNLGAHDFIQKPISPQKLIAQDTLVVEQTGSATSGDLEEVGMLIYYADLPGIESRFISPEDLKSKMINIMCVENTLALGTSGDYSGEEAINSEFDQLKANTDYALLGYNVSVICNAVRWRGSDLGNLGIGGPGNAANKFLTSRWFIWLSQKTGIPLIPVFNSANKNAILVDGQQDEDGVEDRKSVV